MLGVIHVVEREEHNVVTIEFHDRSGRVGSHFNDSFRFSLGALGTCRLPDEDNMSSGNG